MTQKKVKIALDLPLFQLYDYIWSEELLNHHPKVGMLVEVEFGRKKIAGFVIDEKVEGEKLGKWELKQVISVAPLEPISKEQLRLCKFAAKYYLKPIGEVLFTTLPTEWKKASNWPRLQKQQIKQKSEKETIDIDEKVNQGRELNVEQQIALEELKKVSNEKKYKNLLLRGITGSGKTAVYLRWIEEIIQDSESQVLILVPEINLTPQLEVELKKIFSKNTVVVMHSHLTPAQRNESFWKAKEGVAQLVVGTRLAIMAPIKNLKAIIVDEENDASYKQQEGMRYSARDLAIWRGSDLKIPVLLTSATPSCETWQKVLDKKIISLNLNQRAKKGAQNAQVIIVETKKEIKKGQNEKILADIVKKRIIETGEKGYQSIIFINRRGYAPILSCQSCNWKFKCQQCSSYMVLHKKDTINHKQMMQCHHCGLIEWPPEKCPECGNQDLKDVGSGTQKIEDYLEKTFPSQELIRIDADSSRKKGEASKLFERIHTGKAQLIVGTQMITKGHDFERVSTIVVLDVDKSLYSYDFRAEEKLFAQLVQVAGRAGRSEQEMAPVIFIQTEFPEHPIFQAIKENQIEAYLNYILEQRKQLGLPPYSYQALVVTEGKKLEDCINSLNMLKRDLTNSLDQKEVKLNDVVPRQLVKLAGKERAQLLIESKDRLKLQNKLEQALDLIELEKKQNRTLRTYIERDPTSF
ncbi:MAG: primosomal protein N' [Betaproteobacteria bacterium]